MQMHCKISAYLYFSFFENYVCIVEMSKINFFSWNYREYNKKDKEKELDVKEKVLEAHGEGTKLSWSDLSLAIDDNAVF